ncbi:MAG TPA: hypothetical protein PLQ35_16770 [bacterium]|nr:hypothetical protein [bacterium]
MQGIKKSKYQYLSVVVTPEQRRLLDGMKRTGISMSSIVRQALNLWITRRNHTQEDTGDSFEYE